MSSRSGLIRIGLSILALTLLTGFLGQPARAASPGPGFIYPVNGQTLDYQGGYLFKVTALPQAQGYLWGFFQNGVMVWENLRDQGQLSSTEYGIWPDSAAHDRFAPGQVQVWVRGLINGQWTDPTVITITLRPVRVPILALAYFPRDASNPNMLDRVETGWTGDNFTVAQMQQATQGMIDAALPVISDATRYRGYQNPNSPRYMEYYLLEKKEFFVKMPRGHNLGGGAYRPNYGQIMRDINICNYVDTRGVKEVWIYGYHSHLPTPDNTFIVPDESKMSSRYGDVSNALPRDEQVLATYRLPRCTNSYVMYNFTYQPGGAQAIGNTIHNRLHQIWTFDK